MSIIIRLQNLPWEANSLDIRRYFQGLSIPDGGVHIVGGEKGDAFIAFTSDEDARQAMERNHGLIKESRIELYLSSRSEMQKVIDQARNQTLGIKNSDPSTQSSLQGLISSASSGLAASSSLPEGDIRRRSQERDLSRRSMDRTRSRNKSRSRSPNYRNETSYGGGGGVGSNSTSSSSSRMHSSMDVKLDSELMGSGMVSKPMSGISSAPLGYNNIASSSSASSARSRLTGLGMGLGVGSAGSSGGGGPMPGLGVNNSGITCGGGVGIGGGSGSSSGVAPGVGPGSSLGLGAGGGAGLGVGGSAGSYSDPLVSTAGAANRNQWNRNESSNYEAAMMPSQLSNDRLMNDNRMQPQMSYQMPNSGNNMNHPRTLSIELRGLPFNIVPRDLQEFFRSVGLYLPEESIKILVDDHGYTTGGAIIRLNSERDFDIALSMNGRFMGERRIDVMPLPEPMAREEMHRGMPPLPPPGGPPGMMGPGPGRNMMPEPMPPPPPPPPQREYVVYMKGIPYNSCTDCDVADFFQGIPILDIVFEIDPSGKLAGNAYVEFANIDDFNAALDLNLKHMGRRYIELFPTTKEDMNAARRMDFNRMPDRGRNRGAGGGGMNGGDIGRPTCCVAVTGLPPTVTNRDLTNYFMEVGAQPFAIHIMLKPSGYNAGEAFVEFTNPDHQMRAIHRDGFTIGNNIISVKGVSYELMRMVVGIPPMPNGPNGGNNSDHMRHGPHSDIPDRSRDKHRRGRDDFRRKEEKNDRRGQRHYNDSRSVS